MALWREGLLAQKVLQGNTRGYKHHPQLKRFNASPNPLGAIASYLRAVVDEADQRGYHFDRSKIIKRYFRGRIEVTEGQVAYEFQHLLGKLKVRDANLHQQLKRLNGLELHPLFTAVPGAVEVWESV